MKQAIWAFLMSLLLVFVTSSCNDPTAIGDDLVQEDVSNIQTVDTLSLRSELMRIDSVITFTPIVNQQSNRFLVGNTSDPFYGNLDANFYVQFIPTFSDFLDSSSFTNVIIDSVVLDLVYDNTLTYGDTLKNFNLEVFRLIEDIDNEVELFSNKQYDTDMIPLGGMYDFEPRPTTSFVTDVDTLEASDGSDSLLFSSVSPRLRVKLDNAFGEDLLDQNAVNDSTYIFAEQFIERYKGLKIAAPTDTDAFIGFNIFNSSLTVHYIDTIPKSQSYNVGAFQAKTAGYEHSYTGSLIEPLVNNPALGDTLLPMQGLAGLEACIHFPTIHELDDIAINQAILEMTVAYPAEVDTMTFPVAGRLVTLVAGDEEGERDFTEEVGISIGGNAPSLFGGFREEVEENGMILEKIQVNITSVLQAFADRSDATGNKIFLEVFGHEKSPARIVVYGANHPTYPMKLILTYTESN